MDNTKENKVIEKSLKQKLKSLSIILIVIILIILGYTFIRNAIIIKTLSNRAKEYCIKDNFHMITSTHSAENIAIFDTYYKNGQYLEKHTSFLYDIYRNISGDSDLGKSMTYYDGKSDKRMLFFEKEKILLLSDAFETPIYTPKAMSHATLFDESLLHFIHSCFTLQITKEKVNNVECYKFTNFFYNFNASSYFDITTGLIIRNQSSYSYNDKHFDSTTDIIYEFDVVTDDNLKIPNIEEYTLQEDDQSNN